MIGVILRRLALSLLTLVAIVTASFFLQRLAPGGPFDAERELAPETRRQLEREWQLDRPLIVQYWSYLRGMLRLPPDLKRSIAQPDYRVTEIIRPRLAVSLSLGAAALALSLLVGVPLGVLAAVRERSVWDYVAMTVALVGVSVPAFVVGPFLKWVFALELGWLPESRWVGPSSMVLPAVSLSLVYAATISRLVRSGMLEVLDEDWIRTARAKGLSERRVLFRHALPGAAVPLVAYLGPAMAGLAVGSVVIERIFSIPGLGNTFVDAAFNRDYTLVMGTVIVYSLILVVMNLLSDLLLLWIDPRVRVSA